MSRYSELDGAAEKGSDPLASPSPVVVFAVGNPSRGDDALGPILAERLWDELENRGLAGGFELVEDFQLQVEHALDLEGRALALFIDAGTGTPGPIDFRCLTAAQGYGHTTHALAPKAVLQVFRQTMAAEPPPAFVLAVRGESFELGEGLSAAALANMEAALQFLLELSADPHADAWERTARSR